MMAAALFISLLPGGSDLSRHVACRAAARVAPMAVGRTTVPRHAVRPGEQAINADGPARVAARALHA